MKHNMLRTVASLTLAVGVFTGCASASEVNTTPSSTADQSAITSTISPLDIEHGNDTCNDVQFQRTVYASSRNGKYLNFWIKNNGINSVTITINDSGARTIEPGGQGHIYVTVGYLSRAYSCKAVPASNGGRINIEWKIAQRDSQ